jgi:hypothetical protein
MRKQLFLASCIAIISSVTLAQKPLTPETLWELGRVSVMGTAPDGSQTLYRITKTDLKTEKNNTTIHLLHNTTGLSENVTFFAEKSYIQWDHNGIYAKDKQGTIWLSKDKGITWLTVGSGYKDAETIRISPNGQYVAFSKHVTAHHVLGNHIYNDVPNTTAQIYTDLNARHWDTWYDGKVSHLFVAPIQNVAQAKDLLHNTPYDCPTKPFGGTEDYVWSPSGDHIVYVCKKKYGKNYFTSTNTDI